MATTAHTKKNGQVNGASHKYIHVAPRATATQIRRTLKITKADERRVLRAMRAAGISV